MLGQRRRRRANIETTLDQRFVFAGISIKAVSGTLHAGTVKSAHWSKCIPCSLS